MEQSRNNVTSIQDLLSYANGEVVELPAFGVDRPFFARLRRPSIMALAKMGKIPNALLETANELFFEGKKDSALDTSALKNMMELLEVLASACFVEPSWQDIQSAGIQLTDEQLMFVFNYSQRGVKDLKPFRQVETNSQNNKFE